MKLTENQRQILGIIGRPAGQRLITPHDLERQTGRAWQGCIRTAASLVNLGLVKRHSVGKLTYYTITATGQDELP